MAVTRASPRYRVSQIKLFIQINDLETSEFVSEMLGETTQVYKTPIQRPGQGIFAPRVWAPHYTPRPLRSPLELREMSARLSILMVKNSRSFELTKIRRTTRIIPTGRSTKRRKLRPPFCPALRDWQDESLGGAINPAPDQPKETGEVAVAPAAVDTPITRKAPARRPAKKKAESSKPAKAPLISDLTLDADRATRTEKAGAKGIVVRGGAGSARRGELRCAGTCWHRLPQAKTRNSVP